jgi:hypothetical protein
MFAPRPTLTTLLCALGCSACATLPADSVQRALYADVRQVVETRERVGWIIDKYEIEDATPSLLQSVCQVSEESRLELLDWLDRRIEEEGGPAEVAYEKNDGDLGDIEELLTLERIRAGIEHADERADKDCPFWLDADPEFTGVQSDTERFVLIAESFGGLAVSRQNDDFLLGGGGALRILPGYGFNDRITAAIGIELGGSGSISQTGEEQSVSARPVGGIPLLFRVHDDTWVYDLEFTPLTQYVDEKLSFPPGFRIAPAIGIGSVRIGSIMPVAVGLIAYEFHPEFEGLPTTHSIRIGTRIGVNFDP